MTWSSLMSIAALEWLRENAPPTVTEGPAPTAPATLTWPNVVSSTCRLQRRKRGGPLTTPGDD
ncbi:hypothetical protein PAMP_018763 [Pampus punctatissimus]